MIPGSHRLAGAMALALCLAAGAHAAGDGQADKNTSRNE
jgi:hypothetical protein